jgi:hypothetical protein
MAGKRQRARKCATVSPAARAAHVLRVSDRRRAYFARLGDSGKWTLGIVTENEPGYHAVRKDSDVGGDYPDELAAKEVADDLNRRLGLDARDVAMIVASSIRVSDVRQETEDGSTLRRRPNRFRRTK